MQYISMFSVFYANTETERVKVFGDQEIFPEAENGMLEKPNPHSEYSNPSYKGRAAFLIWEAALPA
jgi:hypothetical protein